MDTRTRSNSTASAKCRYYAPASDTRAAASTSQSSTQTSQEATPSPADDP